MATSGGSGDQRLKGSSGGGSGSTPAATPESSPRQQCEVVEACSCPLPALESGGKTTIQQMLRSEPFRSGHLRLVAVHVRDGEIHEVPAKQIDHPEKWMVVDYLASHAAPGGGKPRLLIEREFCPDGSTTKLTSDEKGGVTRVVTKPPGGPGEFFSKRLLQYALAALAGLAAGYAIWGG